MLSIESTLVVNSTSESPRPFRCQHCSNVLGVYLPGANALQIAPTVLLVQQAALKCTACGTVRVYRPVKTK